MKSQRNYLETNERKQRMIRLMRELQTELDQYRRETPYQYREELTQLNLALKVFSMNLLDS